MTRRSTDRGEPDRRRSRDTMLLMGTLSSHEVARPPQTIRIRNLSTTGLQADSQDGYVRGVKVEVDVRGLGPVRGEIIWVRDNRMGVAFADPINPMLARQSVPNWLDMRLTTADEPANASHHKVR